MIEYLHIILLLGGLFIMIKLRKNYISGVVSVILLMCIIISTKANATDNSTIQTAEPLSIGQNIEKTFYGKDSYGTGDQICYYKIDIPQDIGNQYILFTIHNYANYIIKPRICNSRNSVILEPVFDPHENESKTLRLRVGNGATDGGVSVNPGESYYLKISTYHKNEGKVNISVTSIPDDNWGTYENATECSVGQKVQGSLEFGDDIDCYKYVLPNDKQKYTFYISGDDEMNVYMQDVNGVTIQEKLYYRINEVYNEFNTQGNGQTIYLKFVDHCGSVANYSFELKGEKKIIPVLELTGYKKGTKKIIGKTISKAKVTVKVGKRKYSTKSNKNGKFTVKLNKKLKSKKKIKITVSKKNYLTKSQTFKVQ